MKHYPTEYSQPPRMRRPALKMTATALAAFAYCAALHNAART